jgi:hypothetical protein
VTDAREGSALDALRARGADRIDPVRLRLAEALARRAAAHTGDARRLIDARLAALIDDLGARVATPAPARPAPQADRAPGPLAALLAHHARAARPATTGLPGASAGTGTGTGTVAPAPARDEPAGAGYFRATWARLSAEQRLAQSRQRLPDNAGPLNSQHLVHRSLALMHEVSPECLQHFMAQMDGLMWLDQVSR